MRQTLRRDDSLATPEKRPPPAPTAARSSSGFVRSRDGVPVAWKRSGTGTPAVVLVHGWMCHSGFWSRVVSALASSHTVVTLDLAGHGESGRGRTAWTVPAFAEDVRAVVEHLGLESVVLVGHSLGGPVVLEAARLLGGRALAVVGVDTLRDVEVAPQPARWNRLLAALERDFVGTCARMVESWFAPGADPELVASTAATMAHGPADVGLAVLRSSAGHDCRPTLAALALPVRCLNSGLWPSRTAPSRSHAKDFSGWVMDGVGHFPMLEAPEKLSRALLGLIAELGGAKRSTESGSWDS
jgi:pimeloyl-ACP methyl ester carboxylesterase